MSGPSPLEKSLSPLAAGMPAPQEISSLTGGLDDLHGSARLPVDARALIEHTLRAQGNYIAPEADGAVTLRRGNGTLVHDFGPRSELPVRVTGNHAGKEVNTVLEFRAGADRGYVALLLHSESGTFNLGWPARSENNNGGRLVELYKGRFSGQTPGQHHGPSSSPNLAVSACVR